MRAAYGAYELDPSEVFMHPQLADITHPATSTFHEALAAAAALDVETTPPQDRTLVYEFAHRCDAAAQAWQAAYRAAHTAGDAALTAQQRQLLLRARSLVSCALDEAVPPAERVDAYQQVLDVVAHTELPASSAVTQTLRGQMQAVARRLPPK